MSVLPLQPPQRSPWRGLRRVLAVRLDQIGDVLMTTPALAAIRDSLPGAELTLLTSPGAAAAAPHLPMVDHVWACQVPWMKPLPPAAGASLGHAEAALVDRLADGGFDAALIFTVCTQSALPAAMLCRMAGIGLRAAHSRENPYGLLTDWVAETDQVLQGSRLDTRHEVLRQLALCSAVGLQTQDDRLRFEVLDDHRVRVAAQLHAAGIPRGTPYALLHPGATAASRRWPAGHFGAAARQLLDSGCAVVVSGNTAECALAESVLQASGWPVDAQARGGPAAVSMAGLHNLGELAALIAGADVVVANNSAAAHLAAAVGTPVVDLYALTNPQHTPWRVRSHVLSHDVPCRWCLQSTCPLGHNDCVRRVSPDTAARAALDLMAPPPLPLLHAVSLSPPVPVHVPHPLPPREAFA